MVIYIPISVIVFTIIWDFFFVDKDVVFYITVIDIQAII